MPKRKLLINLISFVVRGLFLAYEFILYSRWKANSSEIFSENFPFIFWFFVVVLRENKKKDFRVETSKGKSCIIYIHSISIKIIIKLRLTPLIFARVLCKKNNNCFLTFKKLISRGDFCFADVLFMIFKHWAFFHTRLILFFFYIFFRVISQFDSALNRRNSC